MRQKRIELARLRINRMKPQRGPTGATHRERAVLPLRVTTRGFLGVILLALLPSSSQATQSQVTLRQFMEAAECGSVVRIVSVTAIDPPWEYGGRVFDLRTSGVVLEPVGDTTCGQPTEPVEIYFSSDAHSSQPVPADEVVFFGKRRDGNLVEAVYGRSYWRLSGTHEVVVNSDNDFLLGRIELADSQVVRIPLEAVQRMWAGQHSLRRMLRCELLRRDLQELCN